MTDISRYKNVSLARETYQNLDKIRKVITPHITQSRSGTINILVNKEMQRMNGKERSKDKSK
jgi:hypothetical protein